jgi:hypothetical protein
MLRAILVSCLITAGVFAAAPTLASAAGGDTAPRQGQQTNDSDGDGWADNGADHCVGQPGPANGCPDSDGDSVADNQDGCPTQAGSTRPQDPKYYGCPDRDNDEVPDSLDPCPDQSGGGTANARPDPVTGQYGPQGCPDSDKDGVDDTKDACPQQGGAGDRKTVTTEGCPDRDADNVRDDQDQCLSQHNDSGGPDADKYGCPPFNVGFNLYKATTTKELADGPQIIIQCTNTRLACSVSATLKLSTASARKLGLGRTLFDRSWSIPKKKGSIYFGVKEYFDPSRRMRRAFDRAYANRTSVQLILEGSYRIGSGPWKTLGRRSFTLTHRDPSGAYAFIPSVSAGPKGPDKPRKPSDDDF